MDLFLGLLPILITLVMVVLTKKIGISLGSGIVLGSIVLYYTNSEVTSPFTFIYETLKGILTDFEWSMPILIFIVLVGVSTSLISHYGGTKKFAEVVSSKITNKYLAQIVAAILGLIIFIDDYLNALVVGEVTKPITDTHKVSRAKLAYIVDSTSAPITVLVMISTWGAYIVGLLGDYSGEFSANELFMKAVAYQFYPIIAIVLVFLVIIFDINIGKMKHYEQTAQNGNDEANNEVQETASQYEASIWVLIVPILTLIAGIVGFWFMSANMASQSILETDITIPLSIASILMLVVTIVFVKADQKEATAEEITEVVKKSTIELTKSVGFILIAAWTMASVMDALGTGVLLADLISNIGIGLMFLPIIIFLISALIAFSTGTSWGTFAIMFTIALPLAKDDASLIPILISAVLGGGVMGDHCSPISDTTVLSATGTKCKLDAHFITQLPYALIAGLFAIAGYLLLALGVSITMAYLSIGCLLAIFVITTKVLNK